MKACLGAFDGHLIESLLIVAGDAGVGGIVRVWGVQGGGSGAQGAVHEAFEHGGVEEWVGDWVGLLVFFKGGDREVEAEPLADAEMKVSGAFEIFECEEVFPVGEVLDGGDSVGVGVGDGYLEGLPAFFRSWWRDYLVNDCKGWAFADYAGGRS